MCRGGGIAVRARPGPPRDPTTQGGLKDTVTGMGCRATCSHVPPTHTWTRRSRAHTPTGGPGWPLRGTGHRGRRAKAGSAGRLTLRGLCSPPRARGMLAAAGVGGKPLPPCLGDSGEQEEQGRAGATPHCPVRPLLHAPGQERRRHLCGAGVGAGPQTGVPLLSVWSAQGLRPACSGHGPAHSSKEWTQEGPWAGPGEVDRGFQASGAGTHLTPLVDAAGPGLRRAARPSPERAPAATLLGPGVRWALAARPAGGRPPHFLLACRLRAAWEQRVDCARSGPAPTRHSPAGPVGDVCVCSQARILWPACKGLRAAALSTSRRPGGSGPFPG